ncbi:MAG: 1-(5-phosphoribosyl)-5-[(5-phosphoribosylamino)methylideneamino]imidazole-4-carboxamide isomerase [Candidatus Omnitrophica bacterium]|nr:1-(5-phosphoribosyl)-5-[(5-phosphoribosylamino)methylideneamino]imidazole-4-carboxamide isomerase [Candidatus Omnitrophota bacterium]
MLIIPAIDLKQGKVVRLWKGDFQKATVYADDALKVARRWKEEGAERIHIVDLDGAKTGTPANLGIAQEIAKMGMVVQFGGGIRDKEIFKKAITAGIPYLILASGIRNRDFFDWAVENYLERIIVSIDVFQQRVYLQGWQRKSELDIGEVSKFLKEARIKRVIWTNIERDGTLEGIDIAALRGVLEAIGLPLIIAGGVSSLEDIKKLKGLNCPNLEGLIIGRALYEGRFDLKEAIKIANSKSQIPNHK